MRTLLLLAFLGGSLFAAPVPRERRQPPIEERIQGVWQFTLRQEDGNEVNDKPIWEFRETELVVTRGASPSTWHYKLNPSKTPAEIDIRSSAEDTRPDYIGLVEMQGDKLVVFIRLAQNGGESKEGNRPKDFSNESKRSGIYCELAKKPTE